MNKKKGLKTIGMAIGISLLAILLLASSASAAPYAYVANSGSNNVSVIDAATNNVITSINVGIGPEGVAINSEGTQVYVTNVGSGNVSVINTTTNTVTDTVVVGLKPLGVAVNPAGTRVYVANSATGGVSVIDTSTNTVTATIPVGQNIRGVVVNPEGTKVYVAQADGDTVYVIDTSTNTVTTTISVGSNPFGVIINPVGTMAYVTDYWGNNVSVINTTTNTVTDTVVVGLEPLGVAVNPAGTKVYVANWGSNTVSVINTATNTVIATVNVGKLPYGVSVNPDGTKVYVTNSGDNNVSVIDTSTNVVTDTINVGFSPYGIAIVRNAAPYAYVTGGNISVIDTATNNVAHLDIGGTSEEIAVNSAGTKVYATMVNGGNVSVIDTATNTVTNVDVGYWVNGIAVNPAGTKVYVTVDGFEANDTGNVSVIDTASNTITASVNVGKYPVGVAVNPAGTKLYVTNQFSNNVSVIDTATNTVIDSIDVGEWPVGIAINPTGTMAYVTTFNNVSVIDMSTNAVTNTVNLALAPQDSVYARGIAINPDGTKLYVAGFYSSEVYVIDTTTNTVDYRIGASRPWGVAMNPKGTKVYVTTNSNEPYVTGQVAIIDIATNNVTYVDVGKLPRGIAIAQNITTSPTPTPTPTPPPTPTFSISGFKINNSDSKGIQGWNITLTNSTMGVSMPTNSGGSYKFTNLVNGTYTAAEEMKAGWTNISPTSQKITINGVDIANINFTNQPLTSTPTPTPTPTPPTPVPPPTPNPPTKINVISPNGGENWQAGSSQDIKWKYTGDPKIDIKIELLKGGAANQVIAIYSIGKKGASTYNWKIPSDQAPGKDYRIRITSMDNPSYTDTSNKDFSISGTPTTRCSDAPFIFPIGSTDIKGMSSYIGWIYKESTEGKLWGVTKDLYWINGKGWIDASTYHSGLDFWASSGTPVMGQATGTIYSVEKSSKGIFKPTIKYTDITYTANDGSKKTGDVYVYIDNLNTGKIGKQEIKTPKVGDSVWAGKPIGLIGNAYDFTGKDGRQHIHWSVSSKPFVDQNSNWGSDTPHLDPTSLLTPSGNLNANGGTPWTEQELSSWCNAK